MAKLENEKMDSTREKGDTGTVSSSSQQGVNGLCRWRGWPWTRMESSPIVRGQRQRQEHRHTNGVGRSNMGTNAHVNFFCFYLLSEIEKEVRKCGCKLMRAGNLFLVAIVP